MNNTSRPTLEECPIREPSGGKMGATPAVRVGWLLLALLCGLCLAPSLANAQLPATRLGGVLLAGGQPGASVDIKIAGSDLDGVTELIFSHPGIKAVPKLAEPGPFDKGPVPLENEFVVSIAANVPVGAYEMRALGKYGLSNPRRFHVSDIPEVLEVEPNNPVETAQDVSLPATINGSSDRIGDVDYFSFEATAGQRLIVKTEAQRIDSRLDSVLTLYDAAGRELGSSNDTVGYDSLIDATLPANGRYLVKIHDAAYQGSADHTYRLIIGVLPHIDYVVPLAGQTGGNHPFTIYGRNLPGGAAAGISIDGRPLEKLTVSISLPGGPAAQALPASLWLPPAAAFLDVSEFRVKGPAGSSSPVAIGHALATLVEEKEPNNVPAQAQKLVPPCEVMGQFQGTRDRDWYEFELQADQAATVEVISQRHGLPTNPSLLIERIVPPGEDGETRPPQQLAYVNDGGNLDGTKEFVLRHGDPVHHFVAKEAGTYRVMVRDSRADIAADPRHLYRLVISVGQPDFRLAAVPLESHGAPFLRKGGQRGVRIIAYRRSGFAGDIVVTAKGLPAGVTASETIIGANSDSAVMLLTAAPNAQASHGLVQFEGRSQVGNSNVVRIARVGIAIQPTQARTDPNANVAAVDARLVQDLGLSISAAEPDQVSLAIGNGKLVEAPRGARLKIPYTRSGLFKGNITAVPRNIPLGAQAPQVTIPGNKTTGEFDITLTAATPPGTYTLYLDAVAQQVPYARNPEAAAAAVERQKEVNDIKAKADAEAKTANDAKAAADKGLNDANSAVTAAATAKTNAERALAEAQQAALAATNTVKAAQSAVAANAEDANLKAALVVAQKALDDANAKVKLEETNVANAGKKHTEAVMVAESAMQTKVKADEAAATATQRAQAAAQLKTQTDQLVTTLNTNARPQNRSVPLLSNAVILKVVAAPITINAMPKPGPLKQGAALEVPLKINRMFDFKDPVTVSLVNAGGAAGLSIPNLTIPANQADGKLTVSAAANASPGQFTLALRFSMNLNGQGLTIDQPLEITVEAMPAE